jgi:hypothetical protein
MTTRAALLGAVAALTLGACASGRRPVLAVSREPHAPPRGARAAFAPYWFDDVFANAVQAVRERGLEIARCDPELGTIVTAPVEVDATCWGTTCLARETTQVKLGHRRARVTKTREIWDPGLHAWRPSENTSELEALTREEREMLERLVDVPSTPPRRRAPSRPVADPCGVSHCAGASCVASSATLGL